VSRLERHLARVVCYAAHGFFYAVYDMSNIYELEALLRKVYELPCPVCGMQCTFEIKSDRKWVEKRTCQCPEYDRLIAERTNRYMPLSQARIS
jgi:hypothetical protein